MSKIEGYIYKITNNTNGKSYIGQTKRTVEERWQNHLVSAFNQSQHSYNYPLYIDIRKKWSEKLYNNYHRKMSNKFIR